MLLTKTTFEVNSQVWNLPVIRPTEPGEYRSSFNPEQYDRETVRYWNGVKWSNPYTTNSPENHRNFALKNQSPILPYWLSNE